ncbi:MAG: helix-turn-helix domain-containing protein [Salinibacterium sp.]|nr:helix-turn-helix domain-containing protein [Salinibacterium sp.]
MAPGAERSDVPKDESGSQTLSRGIRILEFVADHGAPASIPSIVAGLGLHRSIVYRLLRTLEQHRLIFRDENGLVSPGPKLASLAASVGHDIQSVALPVLRSAAEDLGATCFLVMLDRDEVFTLLSVEPSRSRVTVAERPGTHHPLGVGGPGRSILAQLSEQQWPTDLTPEQRDGVILVRTTGFSVSHDEVILGLQSIAVPLPLLGHAPLAVAVVYVTLPQSHAEIATRLSAAAAEITAAVQG